MADILPEGTMQVLHQVSTKGNRSRLISDAVLHYVSTQGRNNLAERLKAGAIANADRDLGIAAEWFPLEEDAWQTVQEPARKRQRVGTPQRGEIYLVNFDPTLGAEIQKPRPALVIQNDISNLHSPITIVAALTSMFEIPPYPTEVLVEPGESGLSVRSAVVLNHILSVDRQRLVKRVGKAGSDTKRRVDRAIRISLGLVDF